MNALEDISVLTDNEEMNFVEKRPLTTSLFLKTEIFVCVFEREMTNL